MKSIALCAVAVATVLFSGCVATNVPPPDRRVTMAPDLGTDVYITDIRCAKGPAGIYTFQANMVNNTSSDLPVDWKLAWLDADGMEIDSVASTWSSRMLQPFEVCALKGTAPTSAAVDMMFYVRRARR